MTNREAIRQLALSIVATVKEFPDGAPMGPMYLAFMQHGISLDVFQKLVEGIKDAGLVHQRGDLLFPGNGK